MATAVKQSAVTRGCISWLQLLKSPSYRGTVFHGYSC